jgi:hypothetical protein
MHIKSNLWWILQKNEIKETTYVLKWTISGIGGGGGTRGVDVAFLAGNIKIQKKHKFRMNNTNFKAQFFIL